MRSGHLPKLPKIRAFFRSLRAEAGSLLRKKETMTARNRVFLVSVAVLGLANHLGAEESKGGAKPPDISGIVAHGQPAQSPDISGSIASESLSEGALLWFHQGPGLADPQGLWSGDAFLTPGVFWWPTFLDIDGSDSLSAEQSGRLPATGDPTAVCQSGAGSPCDESWAQCQPYYISNQSSTCYENIVVCCVTGISTPTCLGLECDIDTFYACDPLGDYPCSNSQDPDCPATVEKNRRDRPLHRSFHHTHRRLDRLQFNGVLSRMPERTLHRSTKLC
jgi:hypothetical protein